MASKKSKIPAKPVKKKAPAAKAAPVASPVPAKAVKPAQSGLQSKSKSTPAAAAKKLPIKSAPVPKGAVIRKSTAPAGPIHPPAPPKSKPLIGKEKTNIELEAPPLPEAAQAPAAGGTRRRSGKPSVKARPKSRLKAPVAPAPLKGSVTVTPLDPEELKERVLTPITLAKSEPSKALRKTSTTRKSAATPGAPTPVTPLDSASSLSPVQLAAPRANAVPAPSSVSAADKQLPNFRGAFKISHLPELHFPVAVRVVKAHFDSMLSGNLPEATLLLTVAPMSNIQLRLYFMFSGVRDMVFASMAPEGLLVRGFSIDDASHLGGGVQWHISDSSSQRALSFFARDVDLVSFVMEG
ncbi:hypothetical protein DB346_19860 [Verrucomicrobia bacterium LW23]|nr:hypothetical protein DB346_19860 [Verrucomicrobia bacterium LW23]